MNLIFEDKIGELDELLMRYRPKWQLNAISWMDYDDVCQIIRIHVHKKWHLWKQDQPFKPWASRVISNQIKNLIRNHYSNFCKPCLKCPHNMGGDGCAIASNNTQSEECALFAKWVKKKRDAYNLKLPVTIDEAIVEHHTHKADHFDYDDAETKLHKIIMDQLGERHKAIYSMLFIEGVSEKEVAAKFSFKGDSVKRKAERYKHLSNLKKRFYEMGVAALKEHDIF